MDWLWITLYFLVLIGLSGYGFHRLMILSLYLKHSRNRPEPKAQIRGATTRDHSAPLLQRDACHGETAGICIKSRLPTR